MSVNKPKSQSLGTVQPITIREGAVVQKNGRMHRCMSVPETLFDIRSVLKYRTVDESLHSVYGSDASTKSQKSLSFDRVKIREYARTVGDNPSCSAGPPVSISWEYNIVGDLSLTEYETTRPPRRSHFEMVLPRKVRHDMLRKEWDVTQKQIAESVRRNVRTKNQRKSTVNNLGKATKMEELWESAGRKLKRALTLQKPVSKQVQALEVKVNEVQRRRSQLALEIQMSSECESVHSSEHVALPVPAAHETVDVKPDVANTNTSST